MTQTITVSGKRYRIAFVADGKDEQRPAIFHTSEVIHNGHVDEEPSDKHRISKLEDSVMVMLVEPADSVGNYELTATENSMAGAAIFGFISHLDDIIKVLQGKVDERPDCESDGKPCDCRHRLVKATEASVLAKGVLLKMEELYKREEAAETNDMVTAAGAWLGLATDDRERIDAELGGCDG